MEIILPILAALGFVLFSVWVLVAGIGFLIVSFEEQEQNDDTKSKNLFEKVITILLYLALGYLWIQLIWWIVFDLILVY